MEVSMGKKALGELFQTQNFLDLNFLTKKFFLKVFFDEFFFVQFFWQLNEHAHKALMSICAHESFLSMLMKLSRARAREGVTRTTTIGQYAAWKVVSQWGMYFEWDELYDRIPRDGELGEGAGYTDGLVADFEHQEYLYRLLSIGCIGN